jgi:hypothetical protein
MNSFLLVGAVLSALAAMLHVCIAIGGPSWYRFFGAGEKMAAAAHKGKVYPTLITLGIAVVLLAWSLYAISGSGALPKFPLLKLALCLITVTYIGRGIAGFMLLFSSSFLRLSYTSTFIVVSSAICLGFGFVHLIGLVQVWDSI